MCHLQDLAQTFRSITELRDIDCVRKLVLTNCLKLITVDESIADNCRVIILVSRDECYRGISWIVIEIRCNKSQSFDRVICDIRYQRYMVVRVIRYLHQTRLVSDHLNPRVSNSTYDSYVKQQGSKAR